MTTPARPSAGATTTNDAQDAEKLHDARVAALRKAIMKTAPPSSASSSSNSSSSISSSSTTPALAKNQASAFVRKMMKDSWIAQSDGQLLTDIIPALEGGCVYLPGFLCAPKDYSVLKALTSDLQNCPATTEGGGGMVNWSQHLKFENPDFSPTFRQLLARLDAYFDVEILATRLNFYRDGSDFKPFHHDSHAYGSDGQKEDFTMGASFGSVRELAFRHEASGQAFTFPQGNGDIFAFDSEVNRTFTHGVPKMKGGAEKAGPRFSIIAWGRRRTLNERNSAVTAREADGGQRQERQEGGREGGRGYRGGGGHGQQQQMKKKQEQEGEEEEKEKVVPIGMDEVARLVEKMVLKEEEKQARRALSSSSSSSRGGGGGGGGKERGGGGGKAVGGEAGATKENSSDNTTTSSSSNSSSAKPGGRVRRAGRVQHSWAS